MLGFAHCGMCAYFSWYHKPIWEACKLHLSLQILTTMLILGYLRMSFYTLKPSLISAQ